MDNQSKQPSDELDLGQLFEKIGDFFVSIGLRIIKGMAIVRNTPLQNKLLFISLVFIGGTIGFSYSSFVKRKFYESSMILSSDYLNKRIVDNAIDKLNLLAAEESPRGLAMVLDISDTLAGNIMRFDSKPFVAEQELVEIAVLKEQLKNAQITSKNQNVIDQVITRIEIENQHAFEFTVRTFSPTAIKPLQDALVRYFKNNDYIGKRIKINHENLVAKKGKLQRELVKLDSLKKVIYSNYEAMAERKQGSNNVILSDKSVTDPVQIYNQYLILYDNLQSIERGIFLQPDFELIDGFTQFDSPASAGRTKIVLEGMLIGFLLGYVIVATRSLDKYLSEVK